MNFLYLLKTRSSLIAATLTWAALCFIATGASAVTFTASLDRDTITLGESATLSLTFEGGQPDNTPSPQNVSGLEISYVGPSSQFSFVNGRTSSTVTYHFTLTPDRTGEFTIPAIAADVNGRQLTCQPVTLRVVKSSAPPAASINSGSQVAFMKFTLPKDEVYVGETIEANLELYLRDDVEHFGNFQFTATPADGFTVGKMSEQQAHRVQIGNRVYTDVPIHIVLTAVQTGELSVGPFTASATVVVPSGNQQEDPFFRQFGIRSPFAMAGEQKQISLATEQENVQSLPLPTNNVPPSFNGAIGNYSMTVTAGPTNVAVGDPITVRIRISGRGALDSITLPNQANWKNFQIYPPTSKLVTSDKLGLSGTKTFEEIVSPKNTDVHELPPFSFSYFNPDTRSYQTLTRPSVQLAVRSGGAVSAPMTASTKTANEGNTPPPQDIVPIKEQLGTLAQVSPPLLTRPIFLALQGLPVLAFLAAFVWRKRADSLANNPRLRRQRQVSHLVQNGLNDLRRFAAEKNSNEFFITLFRLLQEKLGERLDCPASSITEAVVDERLASLGTPETTLNTLRELFQLCNQARYAPIQTSHELAAVADKFETVVHELQNVKA